MKPWTTRRPTVKWSSLMQIPISLARFFLRLLVLSIVLCPPARASLPSAQSDSLNCRYFITWPNSISRSRLPLCMSGWPSQIGTCRSPLMLLPVRWYSAGSNQLQITSSFGSNSPSKSSARYYTCGLSLRHSFSNRSTLRILNWTSTKTQQTTTA